MASLPSVPQNKENSRGIYDTCVRTRLPERSHRIRFRYSSGRRAIATRLLYRISILGGVAARLGVRKPRRRRRRVASAAGARIEALAPRREGVGGGVPLPQQLGGLGSVVSSPNGVRGEAPAALRFFAILELILSHGERKDAICTS
jgi:hypothetical protein